MKLLAFLFVNRKKIKRVAKRLWAISQTTKRTIQIVAGIHRTVESVQNEMQDLGYDSEQQLSDRLIRWATDSTIMRDAIHLADNDDAQIAIVSRMVKTEAALARKIDDAIANEESQCLK